MTREELIELSNDTFTSNNAKQITAESHRLFNERLISNMTVPTDFITSGDGNKFLSDNGRYRSVVESEGWRLCSISANATIPKNNLWWHVIGDTLEITGSFTVSSETYPTDFWITNIPEKYVRRIISISDGCTILRFDRIYAVHLSYVTAGADVMTDTVTGVGRHLLIFKFLEHINRNESICLTLSIPLTPVTPLTSYSIESISIQSGIELQGVTCGNGKYVVVGNQGYCAVSTDGLTWKSVDTGFNHTLVDVAYGNGKFVAIDDSSLYITSEDGENWTLDRLERDPTMILRDIIYKNGKFVIVGSISAVSETGTSWWKKWFETGVDFCCVSYGKGNFVAVGMDGRYGVSEDGETWTIGHTGGGDLYGVTYGDGKFVAVGADLPAISTDGIHWMLGNRITEEPGAFKKVEYGNGVFLAIGEHGMYAVSTDGIDWVMDSSTYSFDRLIYEGGKFVGVGDDKVYLFTN